MCLCGQSGIVLFGRLVGPFESVPHENLGGLDSAAAPGPDGTAGIWGSAITLSYSSL